jgi:hypothetical protein
MTKTDCSASAKATIFPPVSQEFIPGLGVSKKKGRTAPSRLCSKNYLPNPIDVTADERGQGLRRKKEVFCDRRRQV